MLNNNDFIEAIGKQANEEDVIKILKKYSMPEHVNIKRAEDDVYIDNEAMGISLLFKRPESIAVEFPSDAPVLTTIFFYGPGSGDYSEYKGELFKGVLFADNREKVIEKLGDSDKFNSELRIDYWSLPDSKRVFVIYEKKLVSIRRIQYGIIW